VETISNRRLPPLELWGGIECTCNRVGSMYMDQLELSGHASRLADLDFIADLGIQALRYPVLWERTAPYGVDRADWSWPDKRLKRLRNLGIKPIVGLVHHGSGPQHTQLDADGFVTGLVDYAAAVARRYPWVEYYTPVNEPLTTARFSGLYGHWFPHGQSDLVFARALLNECKATVLGMRAIREINSGAMLVQTEDLGKTFSTPLLQYQADFENERRWITFDLLTGQLTRDKPIWQFFRYIGVSECELAWFLDNPSPPDVVGCNYYVVGERLLDERVERYPVRAHGGNGHHRYADVDAVRARGEELAGWVGLLSEAWERFGLPLAITEVHLNCHREDQMKWLLEAWQSALSLQSKGVDVRAVTAWSLFGAFNWNTLVTRDEGHYEPGAFDLGSGKPRPTALAKLVRQLSFGEAPQHPALQTPGWWRKSSRFLYPPVFTDGGNLPATDENEEEKPSGAPILITGGRGTLGRAFARACHGRGLNHIAATRQQLDITSIRDIEEFVQQYRPWAVVNAAGYVRVDDAENDVERCRQQNVIGAVNLAKVCAASGVQLLTFSSDLVFSGHQESLYSESDEAGPLNVYGQSKVDAEMGVLAAYPAAIVVRTSAFFGPWDDYNFLTVSLASIANGSKVYAAGDWIVSPTYLPDLVHRCLDLLIDGERGLWHLANDGAITWADFARQAAIMSGLDDHRVHACPGSRLGLRAPRPRFSALGSTRGRLLPPLLDGIRRYYEARRAVHPSSSETGINQRRGKEASSYDIINTLKRPTSASTAGT
jgi:dTDP-4-dehydrorhamnose reductase